MIIIKLNYILLNCVTIAVRIYMKSCFFIGHREADERLVPILREVIRKLVTEEHVRHFYVWGYGGFDQIAGIAVKEEKCLYDGISLNLVFRITQLNGASNHLSDMMEPITRKGWKAFQSINCQGE